jgi:hypothetical protein
MESGAMGKHLNMGPPSRRAAPKPVRIIGIAVALGALHSSTFPTQEV